MSLIMPKGDGTIDAFNFSLEIYYLYRNSNYGWLDNSTFKNLIRHKLNLPLNTDHSMLIKKSELVKYFGLVEYDSINKIGRITPRGINYINSSFKLNILLESIISDCFGEKNIAVPSSNSSIDPPKLLLKSIYDLKFITKLEFGKLLYLTHDLKKTYQNSILLILNERKHNCNIHIPEELKNKYMDPKFLIFLNNVGFLKKDSIEYSFGLFYNESNLKQISNLSIY
ncbi:MAG: hypothetical protein ACRCZR_01795, partial [Cetobacterium sp.]